MCHYHQAAIEEEREKLPNQILEIEQALLPTKHNLTQISCAVDILNKAFKKDPHAIELMVRTDIPCNLDLATMDHIANEDKRATHFSIGGLGLLNGILGPLTGSVVVVMVKEGRMVGFSHQKSYAFEEL